jgi:hypothetical protein
MLVPLSLFLMRRAGNESGYLTKSSGTNINICEVAVDIRPHSFGNLVFLSCRAPLDKPSAVYSDHQGGNL